MTLKILKTCESPQRTKLPSIWFECLGLQLAKQILRNQLSEREICLAWKRGGKGRKRGGTLDGQIKEKKRGRDGVIGRNGSDACQRAPSLKLRLLWFVWFLSATDKLGQIGEEEERGDEKENKKHLISPARAGVKEGIAEEKTVSISEASSIPTPTAGGLRLFQGTQSTF